MAQDSLQRRERLRVVGGPRLVLRELEEEAPADPDYNGVGAGLRQVRRQLGLSVDDVAHRLRFQRRYVRAIEAGQWAQLPGRAYAASYVRSYADLLGLDAVHTVDAFKAESGPPPPSAALNFPAPAAEERRPRGWLVVLALVAAAGVYGWWYTQQRAADGERVGVTPVPERLLSVPAPAPAPPVAVVPAPVPPAPVIAVPAIPASPPAALMVPPPVTAPPVIESTRPVPPVEPLAATPPPAPPPLPPAEAPRSATGFYGAENPDARVVIRATQRAWVRVSQGSQILFARILEPGETYRVPNQPDLTLDAGNLGGTEITVDGRTLPPLGGNGVPRSKIPISPQALLERPAAAN
jgi:hypothetical protein